MDIVENIEGCVDRFAASPKPCHDSYVSIDFGYVLDLCVPLIDVARVNADCIDPDLFNPSMSQVEQRFIEVPHYLHDLPVAQDRELGCSVVSCPTSGSLRFRRPDWPLN